MAATPFFLAILVILPAIFGLLAPSCTADNVLYSGQTLNSGQSLSYRSYVLTMQNDCNLVLYDGGQAVWSSGTNNRGHGCVLRMQMDGNLVIYSNGGANAVWATNTNRSPATNYVLVLQSDRNLVIYGGSIWATGTNRVGTPGVIVTQNVTTTTTTTSPAVAIDSFTTAAAGEEVIISNRKMITMVTN